MDSPLLRVGIDMSILRHAPTGSARWASGLLDALSLEPGLELSPWTGLRRLRRGGPIRKVGNLLRDEYWYRVAVPRRARVARSDVLMMPVNLSAPRGQVPQVVTVLDVNFLSQRGTYDSAYARYAAWAFRRSVREADRLTTISAYSRAEIAAHLGADINRIRVIYPGLAPLPSADVGRPPMDDPYALYVGATEPHKNIQLLIEAWDGTSPGGLTLAVVGHRGRDDSRLRGLAGRMGGRVVIAGPATARALEAWYGGAKAFLFPSLTEGFGFPPLEAMQRSVPVIAANAGALPEVLKDGALFHEPNDAVAVRNHIEHLQSSGAVRQRLVARGMHVAAAYSWKVTASEMAALLREVARDRSS